MSEFVGNKEVGEWQARFAWFNPSEVEVSGAELEWTRLTKEDALQSFRALERMRPFLDKTNLFEKKHFNACREKLELMKNENGEPRFDNQDLRFFDLYFGDARIKIDRRVEGDFDITNGRHRLWMAKKYGIKVLPVLLEEKIDKEKFMSNFELADIEKESLEQHEETEEMKTKIEQHRERADELQEALQKIRAASAEIGSEQMRKVEHHAEAAHAETKRQLEEIRRRRDEMLLENKELAGKVIVENQKRREVHNQVTRVKMMFEGASDEFKSQIDRAGDALSEELKNCAELEESLLKVRSNLENLNI